MENSLLRPLWVKLFSHDLVFIIISFVILGVVRIRGLAGAEINVVVIGFLAMWVLPFIFFDKKGRRDIGILKPSSWLRILLFFILGFFAAIIIYLLGYYLYGTGVENWGMTAAKEYTAQEEVVIPVVFAVITFLSMLFSPIGEEFFFRGMIYEVLARLSLGYKAAGFISSLAFALIHIPHHGIVFSGERFSTVIGPLFYGFL